MSLQFQLRRERHAIGEFNASVTFFKPISANAYADAVARLKRISVRLGLPAPMNMQVMTFDLQAGLSQPQVTDGAGWQRFAPNGEPALSIFCDRDSMQLSCRDYESWASMLPVIVECFADLGEAYIEDVPAVKSFSIRYLNEFRSIKPGMVQCGEMFRHQNWVPEFAFDATDAWHSHMGYFENALSSSRRLINVNLNCTLVRTEERPDPFTLISAVILVSQNYDVPGQPPLAVSLAALPETLRANLDAAHTREKEVLADLFTDPYLAAMGATR